MKKVVFAAMFVIAAPLAFAQTDWPTFGHDAGGQRYSPLKQITPQNVNDLKVAWVYHMKPAGAPDIMPQQGFPGGGPPGGGPPAVRPAPRPAHPITPRPRPAPKASAPPAARPASSAAR